MECLSPLKYVEEVWRKGGGFQEKNFMEENFIRELFYIGE